MEEIHTEFETVHRIWDYFDQPRSGVADYEGRAHWFDCIFDDSRDIYSDAYWLIPLDEQLTDLERKSWDAFRIWQKSPTIGGGDESARSTFERTKRDFQAALADGSRHRFKARGIFRVLNAPVVSVQSAVFQVSWSGSHDQE